MCVYNIQTHSPRWAAPQTMHINTVVVFLILEIATLAQCFLEQAVIKPDYDQRDFLYYKLKNGIKCIAIQHSTHPKSGFAAGVSVGSLSDPIETQGLAHLLEHMLFLGTEQHPEPSSYGDFLAQSGGSSNAFTDEEMTVFYNQIDSKHFAEGLSRFSEFFKDPLLNGAEREKEIFAVDAEHEKNIPSDLRRMWFTRNSLLPFPENHFGTGNNYTLGTLPSRMKINVFEKLKDFHKTYYCGLNMVVVTLSPEPVKIQQNLVEQFFANVDAANEGLCHNWKNDLTRFQLPDASLIKQSDALRYFFLSNNKNTTDYTALQKNQYYEKLRNIWDSSTASSPKLIEMKANGRSTFWITWHLPPVEDYYEEMPLKYIHYMLSSGGRGPLERNLMKERWIHELNVDEFGTRLSSSIILELKLTELGLSHVWDVVERIAAYLNLMQTHGVDLSILDSIARKTNITFTAAEANRDVMDVVSSTAVSLMIVKKPKDTLLEGSVLIRPNITRVQDIMKLLTINRAILVLADREWNLQKTSLPGTVQNYSRIDPFYKVVHRISDLSPELCRQFSNAKLSSELLVNNNALSLPGPITRLPTQLIALNETTFDGTPERLNIAGGNSLIEAWWQGGGKFPTPQARIRMFLRYQSQMVGVHTAVAAHLFCSVVNDLIAFTLADFVKAGYHTTIQATGTGLQIELGGFNDYKQLLELIYYLGVSTRKASINTAASRYERLKQELLDQLQDVAGKLAVSLSIETSRAVLQNSAFTRADMIRVITKDKRFQSYRTIVPLIQKILKVHATVFSMGLPKNDTLQLVQTYLKTSGFKLIHRKQASDNLVVAANVPIELQLQNPIPSDNNNAAVIIFRSPYPTLVEDWVHFQILSSILGTKVYEVLRTEKQLGYVAGAYLASAASTLRVATYLQGSRESSTNQVKALKEVIQDTKQALLTMSSEELHRWRYSVKSDIDPLLINSEDELSRLWTEIARGTYCFNRYDLQAQYLANDQIWNSTAREILVDAFNQLTRSSGQLIVAMQSEKTNEVTGIRTASSSIKSAQSSDTDDFQYHDTLIINRNISSELSDLDNKLPLRFDHDFQNSTLHLTLDAKHIQEFQKYFGFLPTKEACSLKL